MDNLLLLRKMPLFSSIALDELRSYLEKMEVKPFAKDDIICEQEKSSQQILYIVASGHLNMILSGRIIGSLSPLNIFGEASLFSGDPHSATIKAISDGVLLMVKRELFEEIGQKHPKVLINFSRNLGKKLHQTAEGIFKTIDEDSCRTVLILSADSKCGKSVLAVNLAACMHKISGKRTLVLDLCFCNGSCTSILKSESSLTVTDLLKERNEFILSDLQKHTICHSGGFDFLAFAREGDQILENKTAIVRMFKQLKLIYDYIVVDIPSDFPFNDLRLFFVESDDVVILTKDSASCLKNGEKMLEAIKGVYPSLEAKIWSGIFPETHGIVKALPRFCDFILPYDAEIASAASLSGIPFVIGYHNAPISKAIFRLARSILHMRLGLALSSGMAHGLAHIGVLKVLQRENIPIDIVAGTSGGALYAAPFVAGRSLERMEKTVGGMSKLRIFSMLDLTIPYSGFISGNRIINLIKSVVGNIMFEELPIKFLVVSTDIISGETYVFDKGSILHALRASISIPGLFSPVRHEGRLLIDGATVAPVPAEILFRGGADKVIAVNVSVPPVVNGINSKAKPSSPLLLPNLIDTIMHSRAISSYHLAETECRKADLTILPEIGGYHWKDYHLAKEIVEAGEKAATAALPQIKSLMFQHSKI
ncbi:MAG: patatin-like phospholipase family protein [Candidatus Margulisiibacteriota bacterium]